MTDQGKPPKAFIVAWLIDHACDCRDRDCISFAWNSDHGTIWRAAYAKAIEDAAALANRIANLYPHDFDHRHGRCPVHGVADEIAAAIREAK